MKDDCQRYLEDPEAHPGHLVACDDCRALFDTLGLSVDERPMSVGALPLAPWEGASHRAWPLVVGSAMLLLAAAAAVCFWAGVAPLRVAQSSLTTMQGARVVVADWAMSLRQASLIWQIGF